MKKPKYTKNSAAYNEVVSKIKHTTLSMLEIARETNIPYHGVRKLAKIYNETKGGNDAREK